MGQNRGKDAEGRGEDLLASVSLTRQENLSENFSSEFSDIRRVFRIAESAENAENAEKTS